MTVMCVRLQAALAGIVLSTSIVTGQAVHPATGARSAKPTATAAQKAARDIKSLINGVAVDTNQMPIPKAIIRLRNLKANQIEQTGNTNELGEFSFVVQPHVPYVVEIADQAGRIVAVGDVIVTNAGEVAGTVVAIPSRLPALAGLFSDTASSIMSAATGTGLTVVDPTLPKVSPTR